MSYTLEALLGILLLLICIPILKKHRKTANGTISDILAIKVMITSVGCGIGCALIVNAVLHWLRIF